MEKIAREILSKMETMESNFNSKFDIVNNRLGSLEAEVKTGFEGVNRKLDTIYAQVAHNTEQEVKLNELIAKVEDHGTDIKLIKKVVVNQ